MSRAFVNADADTPGANDLTDTSTLADDFADLVARINAREEGS